MADSVSGGGIARSPAWVEKQRHDRLRIAQLVGEPAHRPDQEDQQGDRGDGLDHADHTEHELPQPGAPGRQDSERDRHQHGPEE
jgi:hypothetical protein